MLTKTSTSFKTAITSSVNSLLSIFENPVGLARPFWRDASRHQGLIDFGVSKANGVLGMLLRSTVGWGYQDGFFQRNWAEAGKAGLYRASYHVLWPGLSVIRQADNWYKTNPEIEIIPRVLDVELQHTSSDVQVADAVKRFSDLVLARDGVRPIIYGRYKQLARWFQFLDHSFINDHYYILAQYLWDRVREHPGPPTLFPRLERERVIMHQTADKKPGFPGEAQSSAFDVDRWELGDEADMHIFIGSVWGGEEPTPEAPEPQSEHELGYAVGFRAGASNERTLMIDHLNDRRAQSNNE
jgi:hypothetical protein